MPSQNHEILKLKAIEWLYQVKKCKVVAPELKFGPYIYDVVGSDGYRIYIIEAKKSHNDFLKDCNDPDDIKQHIKEYKELLKETGDTDYIDKIQKEKSKSTKFYENRIFRLANECYVIIPEDVVKEDEVPEGWGLIDENLNILVEAPRRKVEKKWIGKIMGEIAKKYTKLYLKQIGVEFQGKKVIFPERYLIESDETEEGLEE